MLRRQQSTKMAAEQTAAERWNISWLPKSTRWPQKDTDTAAAVDEAASVEKTAAERTTGESWNMSVLPKGTLWQQKDTAKAAAAAETAAVENTAAEQTAAERAATYPGSQSVRGGRRRAPISDSSQWPFSPVGASRLLGWVQCW